MTDIKTLGQKISACMSYQICVENRGIEDYRISTPFLFNDGDELKIILKRSGNSWMLTDEGHTMMYLSYHNFNISSSTQRMKVLSRILSSHSMKDEDGCFMIDNIKTEEDIASAVYTFSQGLLKIGDMNLWRKERAKSRSAEVFKSYVISGVKDRDIEFSYTDSECDPNGLYIVDCCVHLRQSNRPVYLFNIPSSEKAEATTATIYYFERMRRLIPSCAILVEPIPEKSRLRLEAAADKMISDLVNTQDRLDMFLQKCESAA